jgi:hypothetical protein
MVSKSLVECTKCLAKLSIPLMGKPVKIRCPKCQTIMSISAEGQSRAMDLPKHQDVARASAAIEPDDAEAAEWNNDSGSTLDWSMDDLADGEFEENLPEFPQRRPAAKKNTVASQKPVEKHSKSLAADNRKSSVVAKAENAPAAAGVNKLVVAICATLIMVAFAVGGVIVVRIQTNRAERENAAMLQKARGHLDAKEIPEGIALLQEILKLWGVEKNAEADSLLKQAQVAGSEAEALKLLVALTDDQFLAAVDAGTYHDPLVVYPSLRELHSAVIKKQFVAAAKKRMLEKAEDDRQESAAAATSRIADLKLSGLRRVGEKAKLKAGATKEEEEIIAKRRLDDFVNVLPYLVRETKVNFSVISQEPILDWAIKGGGLNADALEPTFAETTSAFVDGSITFNARATPRELSITSPFLAEISMPLSIRVVYRNPEEARWKVLVSSKFISTATYAWQTDEWVRKECKSGVPSDDFLLLSQSIFPETIDEKWYESP